MNGMETLLTRRSVKAYKPDAVSKDLIEQIVEAGKRAPTGKNLQAPVILAITNQQIRDELSKANAEVMGATGDPFYGAPVVLVVLADKSVRTRVYDGSLVMGNMLLAAHELGLGACWIHRARETFEQPRWQNWLKELGLEGEYEGIGNCVVGYPAAEPKAKTLKENWVIYVD